MVAEHEVPSAQAGERRRDECAQLQREQRTCSADGKAGCPQPRENPRDSRDHRQGRASEEGHRSQLRCARDVSSTAAATWTARTTTMIALSTTTRCGRSAVPGEAGDDRCCERRENPDAAEADQSVSRPGVRLARPRHARTLGPSSSPPPGAVAFHQDWAWRALRTLSDRSRGWRSVTLVHLDRPARASRRDPANGDSPPPSTSGEWLSMISSITSTSSPCRTALAPPAMVTVSSPAASIARSIASSKLWSRSGRWCRPPSRPGRAGSG